MKLILRFYLWMGRNKTKEKQQKRLNDFANWASKCNRKLYNDYCENLSKIIREINRSKNGR